MLTSINESISHIRSRDSEKEFPTGILYLDAAMNKISQNDFVVVCGERGKGKSEIAVQIATQNARIGNKTLLIALESEIHEVTDRIRFKAISELYNTKCANHQYLNYEDYRSGAYGFSLEEFESKVDSKMSSELVDLNVYYRNDGNFGAKELDDLLTSTMSTTDLYIIDHLHYFDHDDENENRAIKNLMKRMRDFVLYANKPIVLLAHVRKGSKYDNSIMPSADDVHGSSDITKIATKVISMAPYYGNELEHNTNEFPTIFNVSKNRRNGSVSRYAGIQNFNITNNNYNNQVCIGTVDRFLTKFEALENESDLPSWAKRRIKNDSIIYSRKQTETSFSRGTKRIPSTSLFARD